MKRKPNYHPYVFVDFSISKTPARLVVFVATDSRAGGAEARAHCHVGVGGLGGPRVRPHSRRAALLAGGYGITLVIYTSSHMARIADAWKSETPEVSSWGGLDG